MSEWVWKRGWSTFLVEMSWQEGNEPEGERSLQKWVNISWRIVWRWTCWEAVVEDIFLFYFLKICFSLLLKYNDTYVFLKDLLKKKKWKAGAKLWCYAQKTVLDLFYACNKLATFAKASYQDCRYPQFWEQQFETKKWGKIISADEKKCM